MKIACGLEYNGRHYAGFQKQKSCLTVQAVVETALAKVADSPIEIQCAGRTDAGVHALGQVIHFETQALRKNNNWLLGANSYLPEDVAITWVETVAEDFHARFSANARSYRYVIFNHRIKSGIFSGYLTYYTHPLDVKIMHQAAQALVGEHDFSSFRGSHCQAKTATRFIKNISVYQKKHFIFFDVTANAFLHHMVRNIVGALLVVGQQQQKVEWIENLLKAKDRAQAAITAPSQGLYLLDVEYPSQYQLHKSPLQKNFFTEILSCGNE